MSPDPKLTMWFDPFDGDSPEREQAAIEAHAQALARISAQLVADHVSACVSRWGVLLPDVAGHEATIVPAVAREVFRLAAERRGVALGLARLAARDPVDLAMIDGLVMHVTAVVAAAQAATRNPLRNAGPAPIFLDTPDE